MTFRSRVPLLLAAAGLLLTLLIHPVAPAAPARAAGGPASPFGMNLYITGLERSDAERSALLGRAREAGVRWSREELSWANIQTGGKTEGWKGYDAHLQQLQDAGIAVIGMLLTTPSW